AIEALRPQYFVMENVPGLEMMYEGKTVDRIRSEVSKMGPIRYGITGPMRVNAADFGIPQIRERILFIGHREDRPPIERVPPTHSGPHVNVAEAISDLSFLRAWESDGAYHLRFPPVSRYQEESRRGRLFERLGIRRNEDQLKNHEAARHTPEVLARFAMVLPGEGLESIPRPLWDGHLHSS